MCVFQQFVSFTVATIVREGLRVVKQTVDTVKAGIDWWRSNALRKQAEKQILIIEHLQF